MNPIIDILTYAYRGSGKSILITCAILSVLAALASFAPLFGIIASILFTGYFCAIFYQIIKSTATGGKEAPEFPETSNIIEDMISPMLQVFTVVIVSFTPYFAYRYFILSGDSESLISVVLLALGIIYFPMAILSVVILGSIGCCSPHIVIPSIFRGGWIYWIGILMLCLVYLTEVLIGSIFQGNFILGTLVMAVVTSYSLMTNARVLGIVYRERQDKLHWV
jgi:hypothetical protein|tara:strand:+ start:475 stop:1140 length:666 start_codon:yes stop_codon:yes gene_type:complete